MKNFFNEISSHFSHPNLLKLLALNSKNPYNFIVYSLIPGETLESIKVETLPENIQWKITYNLSLALRSLEFMGLCHNDVADRNIMVKNEKKYFFQFFFRLMEKLEMPF